MSSFQKIVKYFAIALAVFLIVNIVSGIVLGINFVSNMFSSNTNSNLDKVDISSNYKALDIELDSINIIIKNGKKFKIETDSDNISFREIGDKLLVTEKKESWLPKKAVNDLVIYVPNDYIFDNILIENGAGRIEIESLKTNNLDFDLGVGKVNINELIVYDTTEVDGGVGEVVIENSSINNLDFDIGVGNVLLDAEVTGESEISSSIGEVTLGLVGTSEDYSINVEKGIGKIIISEEEIRSDVVYGNGLNKLDLSGGIGNIKVEFKR